MDTTTKVFQAGVALIGLHIADDNFFQPSAGTSAGDHLVSGLVPLTLLALAAWAFPRLSGGRRGALALLLGPLGIATGIEAAHYASQVGPSGDDFTGLLTIPAGLLLIGLGAVTLFRTRRTEGNSTWRYTRRGLFGLAGLVVAVVIVYPTGFAYITTHAARAVVPENKLGAAYEDVSFETSDGLTLKGWYVPSKNGAAVIAFAGRKGPQGPARMLARHGYGVLVFDRRGEGVSDGDPNSFGWNGERDIKAAIDYLQTRPDVDPDRIGGIGLSVGGEMMLEAAAEDHDLKAIVSEGAGARAYSDSMDEVKYEDKADPVNTLLYKANSAVRVGAVAVFANAAPPANLKTLVGRIAPRPVMLIAAPNSKNGEKLNRDYYAAAKEPKTLWEIPESEHMGGIEARPREYEHRVVGFFDEALR
ncbi:MAG TPA: alpha/beta fold hydrolase [Thermoleophilaceae bacterium]|nr:alpha/beta fold hydrolase [Thermoleophilaceae bacterium]